MAQARNDSAAPARTWLSNIKDYSVPTIRNEDASMPSMVNGAAPLYLPAWNLRPGFHLEGDIKLLTRRVITSSVWRDLLMNMEPVSYTEHRRHTFYA